MTTLNYKAKNKLSPKNKPRVYFTCHPYDFGKYFDAIAKDIFSTHDCVIYYTEDMNDSLPEETHDTDLGQMNLFVIAVTPRLLKDRSCRAMKDDIAFAEAHNIPILPIAMEWFRSEDYEAAFKTLQYISPVMNDDTAISYSVKLKQHLDEILLDDKTREQIENAFDATIFLSYRKKDRKYANDLMYMLHVVGSNQTVGIWYDEFLTPGENYSEMIQEALHKSDLFILLITPNLINEDNYVRDVEYPEAKKAGKTILPVMMQKTDTDELKRQFEELPDVIDIYDKEQFIKLTDKVKQLVRADTERDPGSDYLIGLSYLTGTATEVNRHYAESLFLSAASKGYYDAMDKLQRMYERENNRDGACRWCNEKYEKLKKELGEEDPKTLSVMNELAYLYGSRDDNWPLVEKAIKMSHECREIMCRVLGEDHPDTVDSLRTIAHAHHIYYDYDEAIEYYDKYYEEQYRLGRERQDIVIEALENIIHLYRKDESCDRRKEILYREKKYELCRRTYGEYHKQTLSELRWLANRYKDSDELNKKAAAYEKLCDAWLTAEGKSFFDFYCIRQDEIFGTLIDLYQKADDRPKEIEARRKQYKAYHKYNLSDWQGLIKLMTETIDRCRELGEKKLQAELMKELLITRSLVFGPKETASLPMFIELTELYEKSGTDTKDLNDEILFPDIEETFEVGKALVEGTNGEKDINRGIAMITEAAEAGVGPALSYMCHFYSDKRYTQYDPAKACEWGEAYYSYLKCYVGEEHDLAIESQRVLAFVYSLDFDYKTALKIIQDNYEKRCRLFGENDPRTLEITSEINIYKAFADITDQLIDIIRKSDADTEAIQRTVQPIYDSFGETLAVTVKGIVDRILNNRWKYR